MFLIERFRRREDFVSPEYNALWEDGNVFHTFRRRAISSNGDEVDRLEQILDNGLVPPSLDTSGKIVGNWPHVKVVSSVPNDSVVFMHRVDSFSRQYRPYPKENRDALYLFVDKEFPVLTPRDMGSDWPIMTLGDDEVYSREVVAPINLKALIVPVAEANDIAFEFASRLKTLDISLFNFAGVKVNK